MTSVSPVDSCIVLNIVFSTSIRFFSTATCNGVRPYLSILFIFILYSTSNKRVIDELITKYKELRTGTGAVEGGEEEGGVRVEEGVEEVSDLLCDIIDVDDDAISYPVAFNAVMHSS